MRRICLLLACAGALFLGACGGDRNLPDATGKASIRAINAIPTSPELSFLIEERVLGSVPYQGGSTSARYDDLDYNFNFDVRFAGESNPRRIATQHIDVVADRDYTLLITGTVTNATITLWEDDERLFDSGDTVFQAKFAHAAASVDTVDYYFAAQGVAPVLGEQFATLSFREVSPAFDFEQGEYVITITAAGDPGTILYQSPTAAFPSQAAFFVTAFDGSENNTAPVFVNAIGALGSSIGLPDPSFPPTIEFVNASLDLGTSDIYSDEALTLQVASDHAFRDVTAEIPIPAGENTFYYTPAGDTAAVTLEAPITAFTGLRYRMVAAGTAGALAAIAVVPEHNPVGTHAKLIPFHTANNFDVIDIYLLEDEETIEDTSPRGSGLGRTAPLTELSLAPGSYDLVITEFREKDPLAGPYRLEVTTGDIVDFIVVDAIDPAVLDVLFLSGGPTP